MKFRAPSSIEPLENRIAPATIYIGAAVASVSKGYTQSGTPFTPVSTSGFAADMGASSDTYFLSLHAGDKVMLYTDTQLSTFITVTSGNAVVFFHDDNNDGRAESTEISGVALGKNVSMTIAGPVNGDVATNLNDDGSLTLNSTGLNNYAIKSLVVSGGGISGGVYSGGAINKLNVAGNVTDILTGTAANGFAYDYNGSATAGGQTFSVTAASGQAGPNIQKVNVVSVTDMIEAGDGGAGAKGGSLTGITVTNDTDGFTLQAGNGGAGDATHVNGGAGGTITNTYINGPVSTSGGAADTTPNSLVNILAGDGGASFTATGKGGAGGSISQLYIGYKASTNGPIISADFIQDNVLVQAGDGGDGGKAGAGGSVTNSQISTITPDDTSDPSIIELQVLGGDGGTTQDGTAGKGGAVQLVKVRDLNPDVLTAGTSDILVAGGDGGLVGGSGKGAAGGSASSIFLVGFQIAVTGGNGSDGDGAGGNGGSLSGITVSNSVSGVVNNSLVLTAGNGGNTNNGKAGVGGSISGVSAQDVNFTDSDPSDSSDEGLIVTAGVGGSSSTGKGANGGSVSSFTVTDQLGSEAYFDITAGDGGSGATKAGNGGSISSINSSGDGLTVKALAGNGGDTTSTGSGGTGGSINGSAFVVSGSVNGGDATISVTAGTGGVAATLNGGAGGSINNTSLVSDGDVTVLAGDGGAGAAGHAGSGGSISNTSGQSSDGSANFTAGSANATGTKSGTGGSITNANILGLNSVTIIGGDGSNGGAGGSLTGDGFSGASNGSAPLVNVTVQAGAGSAANSTAGAGGSIVNMTGYVGELGTTAITAGSVVGSATVGAAGGSISGLTILGGGGSSAVLTITAGDASDASTAKTGAKGGSVSNVTILGSDGTSSGIDQGTDLQSIAAGNGGAAVKTGGAGGSITNVFVTNHDIGVRSGADFGYSSMGGLFAGVGGSGTTAGVNGDVINITADAIATIIAGKADPTANSGAGNGITIQLVNKVDKIFLDGNTAPTFDTNGAYTNIDSANFVGGVVDPNASNASTYHYTDNDSSGTFDPSVDTPLDGLIATKSLSANRNFTPGALLTVDANGNLVFQDPTNV